MLSSPQRSLNLLTSAAFQQQKLAQGAGHHHRHAVPVRRRLRVRGHLRGQLWHRGLQLQTAGPGAAGRLRLRPGLRRVQRESGALTGKEHTPLT